MTAAYRLKGTGWLMTAVVIALGFYLVSLRVADERKRLEAVNGRIAAAQRDIRALETEFDTRANLVQLEKWNGDTLALAAPTAGQFVHDESQLAAIDVAAAGQPQSRTAALVVPSIVAPAAVLPVLAPPVAPVAVAATTSRPAAARPAERLASLPANARAGGLLDPAGGRSVVKAVATEAAPSMSMSMRALARLASAERTRQAVAKVRPQAVAMLDDKLLSDATLGDLIARARREARIGAGSGR